MHKYERRGLDDTKNFSIWCLRIIQHSTGPVVERAGREGCTYHNPFMYMTQMTLIAHIITTSCVEENGKKD